MSKPAFVLRSGTPDAVAGSLGTALSIADFDDRKRAIQAALTALARGGDDGDSIRWMLEAAVHLNGLPASALDTLAILPSSPTSLVRLLFNARNKNELRAVWNLQEELPFLWLALPFGCWGSALNAEIAVLARVLEDLRGPEAAGHLARQLLDQRRIELLQLEPALEVVFTNSDEVTQPAPPPASLRELAGGYVMTQAKRIGRESPNEIASELHAQGLGIPRAIADGVSHTSFAGLFAPVFLAASARGRISLNAEQALLARRTLREDADYVTAAWRHLLKFYESV